MTSPAAYSFSTRETNLDWLTTDFMWLCWHGYKLVLCFSTRAHAGGNWTGSSREWRTLPAWWRCPCTFPTVTEKDSLSASRWVRRILHGHFIRSSHSVPGWGSNIHHTFPSCSASHLVDVNGGSAGVWTSTGFSSLEQTTAEGTFNVRTWRAATTTSEKRGADQSPALPPLPNPKTTTWPRARAPPWITAVCSALCFLQRSCLFFKFQIEKKGKKIQTKEQADKRDTCNFFLFISVVDQALTSNCWRESPRRFTRSLDCLLMGHPIRGGSASCRRMKIYALLGYIFYIKAGGRGFNATLCKGKQIKSGTSIEIRLGLGCGTWCHCGTDNLAE